MNYLILRNHGLLTVGPTVAEALTAMYGMERSCQAQVAAMACNTELNHMSADVVQKSIDLYDPTVIRRYGLLEWPGLLRKLDRLPGVTHRSPAGRGRREAPGEGWRRATSLGARCFVRCSTGLMPDILDQEDTRQVGGERGSLRHL
jgi:hypothetical protein